MSCKKKKRTRNERKAIDKTLAAFIPMEKTSAGYKSDFTFDLIKWGNIKKKFTHFANGDVAFAKITPCFQNRKSAIFHDLSDGIGAGTTELKVLRPYGNTINRWYLLYFLEFPYFIMGLRLKKQLIKQQRYTVSKAMVYQEYSYAAPLVPGCCTFAGTIIRKSLQMALSESVGPFFLFTG